MSGYLAPWVLIRWPLWEWLSLLLGQCCPIHPWLYDDHPEAQLPPSQAFPAQVTSRREPEQASEQYGRCLGLAGVAGFAWWVVAP